MADKVKNEFVFVGKVTKVFPEVSGEGKKGLWRKQEFHVVTENEYPKNIPFVAWNDLVEKVVSTLVEGTRVKVSFDIDSNLYNDKLYISLKAYKIQIDEKSIPSGEAVKSAASKAKVETVVEEEEDDLPF